MSTELLIESSGPLMTLQDAGRLGWQRIGLSPSGALDLRALCAANALVGNSPLTPAIELFWYGARLRAIGGVVRLALAGADFPMRIGDERIASHTSFRLSPGEPLVIGHACRGGVAMLACEGGYQVGATLGSVSLHVRAEVGGHNGRPLAPGDLLPVLEATSSRSAYAMNPLPLGFGDTIRVVQGPQFDQFGPAVRSAFFDSEFTVTADCDRMGFRLSGPRIRSSRGHNIVSDGVVAGSIQIPGSGQPIVMMADRQTTGGYPKIATIITADQALLAQRRPGEKVRFRSVTIEEAQTALRRYRQDLDATATRIFPAGPSFAWLAAPSLVNLAGTAISARDVETWDSDGVRDEERV